MNQTATLRSYTISLRLQCINSLNQIRIPCQRGDGLRRIALDDARDMRLQSSETHSELGIQDIDAPLQVPPQACNRIQLGTRGWQPDEDDMVRNCHTLRHMRRGLVEEQDSETLGILLAQLLEKDREAGGIQAGALPPECLARRGLDGGIEPGILLERLDDLERLHAVARQPSVEG
jgi:hypothetical protein